MSVYGLSLGTVPGLIKEACALQGDVALTRIALSGKIPEDVEEDFLDVEDAVGRAIRLLNAMNARAVAEKPVERERSWVADGAGLAEVTPDSVIPGWTDTPDVEDGDVAF